MTFDMNGTREQAQITMLQYRQELVDSPIRRVTFGRTDENISFNPLVNETVDTVFPGESINYNTISSLCHNFCMIIILWFICRWNSFGWLSSGCYCDFPLILSHYL